MENREKIELRSQVIEAAVGAESMTEGFRIITAFTIRQRSGSVVPRGEYAPICEVLDDRRDCMHGGVHGSRFG